MNGLVDLEFFPLVLEFEFNPMRRAAAIGAGFLLKQENVAPGGIEPLSL
jgi:hypothetical protein